MREDVAVEIGKGGAQPVIPFLSDPGGNKEEIRNRAMSGLGACWAAAEQGVARLGSGFGGEGSGCLGLEGAIIVIYIRTRTHDGRLMGKQAVQGGRRAGEASGLCS